MYARSNRFVSLLVACLAAGATLMAPAAASADDNSIAYQGEVDTAGPLVMDTTSAADPQTTDFHLPTLDPLMIQRMPVTKTITAITLGDLGRPESCGTSPPQVSLTIYSNGSTGYAPSTLVATSSDHPVLPTTMGRLTWHLPTPLTMLAGRSYTFRISFYASYGCSHIVQTTWRHNSSRVEAAPPAASNSNTCQTGVPLGASAAQSAAMRQWHVQGNKENTTGCIFGNGSLYGPLDPSMPTGWLVSYSPNGSDRYLAWYHGTSSCAALGTTVAAIAPTAALWRVNSDGSIDTSCLWTQFYDYGYQSRYGWWYAMPFRQGSATPRAMYVKLDAIDYNAYLQQYAPALKYDGREPFFAMAADSITNSYQPALDWWNYSNTLQDKLGDTWAAANPAAPDVDTLSLGYLGYAYHGGVMDGTPAQASDFIDEVESSPEAYEATSKNLYLSSGYADQAYGRAVQDPSGSLWLQYWFWYYYNDGRFDGYFDHEGDWENIQVKLTPTASNNGYVPVLATYAMHTTRATCNWSLVPQTNGSHPVVYVSLGRHASYFTPDKTINGDQNDGSGPLIQLAVTQVHSYTDWIRWPGRWGSTERSSIPLYNKLESDSPAGPSSQAHSQWADPAAWDGGDSHTDKCPDVGVIISRRQHGTRFSGHGHGPKLRVHVLSGSRVQVAWRVSRRANRVILSARSVSATAPASTHVTETHGRRRGVAYLVLPPVSGTVAVSGTSVYRGRFSRETVTRVRP